MPQSEADIIRPYQLELDKTRLVLANQKRDAAEVAKEVNKIHAKVVRDLGSTIATLEQQVANLDPDGVSQLKSNLIVVTAERDTLSTQLASVQEDKHYALTALAESSNARESDAHLLSVLRAKVEELEGAVTSLTPKGGSKGNRIRRSNR